MLRLRSSAAVAILGLLLAAPAGGAPDTAAAQAMVEETLDEVLAALRKPDTTYAWRSERIQEIAFPRFDFETISRLVLGRNWKTLNAEQQAAFIVEFKRHLTLSYGRTIDDYKSHEFLIRSARAERNDDVTVRTQINADAAQPFLIDYRVRNQNDGWRVIDVVVEGVSLVQNFRDQSRSVLRDVGPDGLIERLRAKNAEREQG
jgi:phospholipid transport system substrate-binding protein